MDVFVGERDNNVNYFENIGSSSIPIFELSTDTTPFGLSNVFPRSAPSFVDIDGDGDFDVFIGSVREVFYYENIGDASNANFSIPPLIDPFGLIGLDFDTAPSFVDIDGDGDSDVFIGESYNINFYKNTSTNSSIPNFLYPAVDVGRWASPRFADIDADGDLDGFIGEREGFINYFENTGSNENLNFELSTDIAPFGLARVGYYAVPSIVDIDDDGDLDMFIGTSYGTTRFYENVGSNSNPNFNLSSSSEPFGITDIGFVAAPDFVDIDDDGDLDAFVGLPSDGIQYFENIGNASSPSFSLSSSSEPFGLADVSYGYYIPSFVDVDNDGDLDAFIGNVYGTIDYYENIGNASSADFSLSSSTAPFGLSDVGTQSNPTILDIDGDGLLEAVIGNFLGNLNYFESNISSNERIECEGDDIVLGTSTISSGDYNAKSTFISKSTIEIGSLVRFTAGETITLSSDFQVENGAEFIAQVVACFPDNSVNLRENEIFADTKLLKQDISISPNPTSGETTLQFDLPSATTMQVAVYNGMGQLVEVLVDKQSYDIGNNSIAFSTAHYEDGVYWVLLRSAVENKTLRLLVFRR